MEQTDAEIAEYIAFVERLADAAAAVTMKYFRVPIAVDHKPGQGPGKSAFDPVTAADREAETVIRDMIAETYPEHAILGEEHGHEDKGDNWINRNTWVIDPIDGTRAFISGLPLWGTLIALNTGEGPVLGVVDHPATGERFIGGPGLARLNGRDIRVRGCATLADATLSTTDPDLFDHDGERDAFAELARRVRLKRYGYDCYAYTMVAAGFIDLVVEAGLAPYDVQAIIPLVKGAGGIVTDWQGGPADDGGQIIAAGDARVHEQALAILRKVKEDNSDDGDQD